MPDPNSFREHLQTILDDDSQIDSEQQRDSMAPFRKALTYQMDASRVVLKSSLETAKQVNPDTRARAMELAKVTRLPVDIVESNLDEIAASARSSIDVDALRRDHPDLATWLEHPDRAAISHDDLPVLRQLDVAARALRGDDPTGVLPPGYLFQGDRIIRPIGDGSQAESWDNLEALAKDLRAKGERALTQEIDSKLAADRYAQDYGWAGNLVAGAGQSLMSTQRALGTRTEFDRQGQEVVDASMVNAPGWFGDVQRGIGGLVADAPLMLAGAPLAKGVSVLAQATRMRGALSTVVGRAAAKRITTGLQVAAASQPLAAREGITEGQDHGAVDGALAWLVESAVPGAFGRTGLERAIIPGATDVVADGWRGTVKRLLVDAGMEGTEEAVTEFAHAVREYATGADPTALDADKLLRRLSVAGTVGAAAGGAFNLPVAVAEKFARDGEEARRATVHAERLDRLVDVLAESKTNGRAPDEVKAQLETTLGQGGRHVFVDAEQFRAAFDDPAAAAAELGIGEEYTRALATGGQVQVPTVTLLQKSAADEQFRKLIPNTRRTPEAQTATEGDEFAARAPEAIRQLQAEAKAATSDATQKTDETAKQVAELEQELTTRLSAVSPEQVDRGAIKRQARIVASAFGALAKRTGKTPQELFTLKLRGDTVRMLRGERFDLMDAMIERLRKLEVPSDREAFGPSLVDFLREKGLADKTLGGELASLKESDRTRKPGERNLVRDDGIDLDTAAMYAAEAGYISEATPNALLEALDNEVRGNSPTFSEKKGGNPQAQAMREALTMLDDTLRAAGVDINASNQEIRKALADYEERQGAQGYNQGVGTVSPKGTSLDFDALLRQWRKATGDRTPIGGMESWQQLVEESAKVDEANGVELNQGAVETPAFRNWFGDSKVVDSSGNPLVVWHGTKGKFKAFDEDQIGDFGFHFGTKGQARKFSKNPIPVLLSIQNPIRVPDLGTWSFEIVARELDSRGQGIINSKEYERAWDKFDQNAELRKILLEKGYDGFVYENEVEGSGDSWVAFKPTQIKSTENSGAFDPSDPVIFNQTGKKEDRRGSIKFNKGQGQGRDFTISLFRTADASTFLHESGHLFLEMMGDLSKLPTADQSLKDDAQRVLDWLGAKDFASITEDQHETFARGFERYLMEGVAPASHLREAFARIKAWMVAIYRTVANLDVELTPEIRGVFDRLVAAEDSIDQAEAAHGMDALLPPESFPSLAEWERYREAVQTSRQASRDRLEAQLIDAYQQEATKAWKAQRADIEAEVAREVDAMPVYQAMYALQRGTLPDGTRLPDEYQGAKLDKADLVAQWGDAVLDKLPGPGRKANAGPYLYAVEGGLPVDQVARMWGFPSGDALVESLIQADDHDTLIQATTDKRMKALRPDPMTDGTLTDKANAALATDQRAEVFRRELSALGRRTGQTPAPVEVLRQIARDQIARTKVYDLAPDKFRIAAAKAARRAMDAASRQQWDDAYRAKTQEALNLELFRAARDAKEAGESGRAYLRTFDTLAKRERLGKAGGWEWTVFNAQGDEVATYTTEEDARDAWTKEPQGASYRRTNGYLEQINAILDGFQLRRASTLSLRRRDAFLAWIGRQEAEGEPVDIDPQVRADIGQRNWNDLTVEEQGAVVDAVRNVEKLAQLKNKLLKASRERDLDAARSDIINTIIRNQPKELPDGQFDDLLSRATGKLVGFFESHRKDSFLARRMDGDVDGGAVWDYLIRSRNEAAGEQETRSAEESAKLSALFQAWGKKAGSFRQEIPGTKLRLTTEQRIVLALNWGNNEGRQRVMAWLKRGNWSANDAQAVLDSLDAADWKLVNGIVAQINAHWSDVAALEQRTKGIAPEKVQALPFVTKAGVQPGGYYPIKYDPKKSTKAGDLNEMALAREMQKAAGANAQTRRGHTKLRALKVDDLALRFDFGVIGEHLSEVVHDLTHRELILDQNRLLRDPEISKAILSRYGRGALDQFVKTATDIAVGDAPARTAAERMMKSLRVNNSAATFGWNLTSALMNLTGFSQSMTRVGPVYMAQAVARLYRSPDQINNGFRFAVEKSDFMRNRANTLLREVADATRAVQTGGSLSTIQRWGYYPMTQVQRAVDTVTWLGAYEQALAQGQKSGKTGPEADALAVAVADQTVQDTQGSGRIGDLSAFQRGGELSKLLTAFYSYFNVAANLQGSAIGRVYRNPANAKAWARLVTDTALVWTLPALFGSLIKSALQGDERKDEEWVESLAREQAAYGAGMLVGLREASGLIEGHFGYSGPAGTRGLALIAKGVGEAFDGDLGKADAKALSSLVGTFTGLPAVQVNRLIDAIAEDAANGKEGESLRRAVFGAPRQ